MGAVNKSSYLGFSHPRWIGDGHSPRARYPRRAMAEQLEGVQYQAFHSLLQDGIATGVEASRVGLTRALRFRQRSLSAPAEY